MNIILLVSSLWSVEVFTYAPPMVGLIPASVLCVENLQPLTMLQGVLWAPGFPPPVQKHVL